MLEAEYISWVLMFVQVPMAKTALEGASVCRATVALWMVPVVVHLALLDHNVTIFVR